MGMLHRAVCKDEQIRRALIVGRSDINGIDYLNVDPANHARLTVVFLNPVGPNDAAKLVARRQYRCVSCSHV